MASERLSSKSDRPRRAGRAWTVVAVLILGAAIAAAIWKGQGSGRSESVSRRGDADGGSLRLVSLSPGVTDTIDALGAADRLVGLSDYCALVGESKLPRVGSALTPNYEMIAGLSPDAIVTSEVKGEMLAPLEKLAPTHRLPWLSLAEWRASILALGAILHRPERAAELERTVAATLDVSPPPGAPRVLLALDYGDSGSSETWFIRKNSIHGAVLRAAGGQNAVDEDVTGHPKLSPEQLLALDPDVIVVLTSNTERSRNEVRQHFDKWSPLRAVRDRRIGLVASRRALDVGPTILELVPLLEKELSSLGGGGTP